MILVAWPANYLVLPKIDHKFDPNMPTEFSGLDGS